jgi:hypothetical protein
VNELKGIALVTQAPIVVFGTGGSGTRVVARILKDSGCFIGTNLNRALDNQDFGFLLAGRVDWMVNSFPFTGEIAQKYLALFRKVFFQQRLQPSEYLVLMQIAREYLAGRSKKSFRQRPFHERIRRGMQLLQSALLPSSHRFSRYQQWGFKSPEAIYLVEPIIRFFPGTKLIHVVRDGRDMALSTRRNPLMYLEIFNIEEDDPFRAALANWCAVNAWARERCEALVPSQNYLLIRYEDICQQPSKSVDRILSFGGIEASNVESIYGIPKPNPTIQRWKKVREYFHGLDTSVLKNFGYPA